MVKLTKFNKIQTAIDELVKQYETSKDTASKEELERMTEEYKRLRVLLRSNNHYFENLTEEKLEKQGELKLREQKVYEANAEYINKIEEAATLDDLTKTNEVKAAPIVATVNETKPKKVNLVRKNWKKVVLLAATMTALMATVIACGNKNKKVNTNTEDFSYVDQTDAEVETTEETITLNDLKDAKAGITLRELPKEFTKREIPEDVKKELNINSTTPTGTSKNEVTVEEKALDPHVSNSDKDTKKVTKTEILPEKEAKEPKPVDYPTTEKDKTKPIPSKEKVTVTEVEEKTEPTTPPTENNTNPTPTPAPTPTIDIPEEEIVTIIEEEEEQPTIDPNMPVEDTTVINSVPETQPTVEETTEKVKEEEKVTIIEEEETETIDLDELPIEETTGYTLKLVR